MFNTSICKNRRDNVQFLLLSVHLIIFIENVLTPGLLRFFQYEGGFYGDK